MTQNKVLGIIGHPIDHTLSPLMHNRAIALLGLSYVYTAFGVHPDNLKKAMGSIAALGIAGLNVTVPHKEKVISHLDHIEEEAAVIGAVNTVIVRDGEMIGANTDGHGFIRSLKNARFKPAGKRVAIVGAGGSARAIGIALLRAGAAEVAVVNRSTDRGKKLVKNLMGIGNAFFVPVLSDDLKEVVATADMVVQTTTCGMKKSDPLPIAVPFRKGQLVYDIIYSPWQTRFLGKAEAGGAKTLNGLGMLVYQGSESFRRWTGISFPEEKILKWLKQSVSGRK